MVAYTFNLGIFSFSAFKVFKGIILYILLLKTMVKLSIYHDIIKDLNPDDPLHNGRNQ